MVRGSRLRGRPSAGCALHLRSVCACKNASLGLRCHPLTCISLKLRLSVDSSPTRGAILFCWVAGNFGKARGLNKGHGRLLNSGGNLLFGEIDQPLLNPRRRLIAVAVLAATVREVAVVYWESRGVQWHSSQADPPTLASGDDTGHDYRTRIGLSSVQNRVISSSDRPLVSGISQATRMTVDKAPALKSQKVPSDPKCFCMIGKD